MASLLPSPIAGRAKAQNASKWSEYSAPEPVFRDGKDAFHRVPFIPGEVMDAVERVLTKFRGARRAKIVRGVSPRQRSAWRGLEFGHLAEPIGVNRLGFGQSVQSQRD